MRLLFAVALFSVAPANAAMVPNALTKSPCFFENRYKLEIEMINDQIRAKQTASNWNEEEIDRQMSSLAVATHLHETAKQECEKKRFIQ